MKEIKEVNEELNTVIYRKISNYLLAKIPKYFIDTDKLPKTMETRYFYNDILEMKSAAEKINFATKRVSDLLGEKFKSNGPNPSLEALITDILVEWINSFGITSASYLLTGIISLFETPPDYLLYFVKNKVKDEASNSSNLLSYFGLEFKGPETVAQLLEKKAASLMGFINLINEDEEMGEVKKIRPKEIESLYLNDCISATATIDNEQIRFIYLLGQSNENGLTPAYIEDILLGEIINKDNPLYFRSPEEFINFSSVCIRNNKLIF